MTIEQIAFATDRTKRLIREYEQIIEEYKDGNYNMKQLENMNKSLKNTRMATII